MDDLFDAQLNSQQDALLADLILNQDILGDFDLVDDAADFSGSSGSDWEQNVLNGTLGLPELGSSGGDNVSAQTPQPERQDSAVSSNTLGPKPPRQRVTSARSTDGTLMTDTSVGPFSPSSDKSWAQRDQHEGSTVTDALSPHGSSGSAHSSRRASVERERSSKKTHTRQTSNGSTQSQQDSNGGKESTKKATNANNSNSNNSNSNSNGSTSSTNNGTRSNGAPTGAPPMGYPPHGMPPHPHAPPPPGYPYHHPHHYYQAHAAAAAMAFQNPHFNPYIAAMSAHNPYMAAAAAHASGKMPPPPPPPHPAAYAGYPYGPAPPAPANAANSGAAKESTKKPPADKIAIERLPKSKAQSSTTSNANKSNTNNTAVSATTTSSSLPAKDQPQSEAKSNNVESSSTTKDESKTEGSEKDSEAGNTAPTKAGPPASTTAPQAPTPHAYPPAWPYPYPPPPAHLSKAFAAMMPPPAMNSMHGTPRGHSSNEEDGQGASKKPERNRGGHYDVEKRYRDSINGKIQELKHIVPSCANAPPSIKLNKATILRKTIEYVRSLEAVVMRLQAENAQAKGSRTSATIPSSPVRSPDGVQEYASPQSTHSHASGSSHLKGVTSEDDAHSVVTVSSKKESDEHGDAASSKVDSPKSPDHSVDIAEEDEDKKATVGSKKRSAEEAELDMELPAAKSPTKALSAVLMFMGLYSVQAPVLNVFTASTADDVMPDSAVFHGKSLNSVGGLMMDDATSASTPWTMAAMVQSTNVDIVLPVLRAVVALCMLWAMVAMNGGWDKFTLWGSVVSTTSRDARRHSNQFGGDTQQQRHTHTRQAQFLAWRGRQPATAREVVRRAPLLLAELNHTVPQSYLSLCGATLWEFSHFLVNSMIPRYLEDAFRLLPTEIQKMLCKYASRVPLLRRMTAGTTNGRVIGANVKPLRRISAEELQRERSAARIYFEWHQALLTRAVESEDETIKAGMLRIYATLCTLNCLTRVTSPVYDPVQTAQTRALAALIPRAWITAAIDVYLLWPSWSQVVAPMAIEQARRTFDDVLRMMPKETAAKAAAAVASDAPQHGSDAKAATKMGLRYRVGAGAASAATNPTAPVTNSSSEENGGEDASDIDAMLEALQAYDWLWSHTGGLYIDNASQWRPRFLSMIKEQNNSTASESAAADAVSKAANATGPSRIASGAAAKAAASAKKMSPSRLLTRLYVEDCIIQGFVVLRQQPRPAHARRLFAYAHSIATRLHLSAMQRWASLGLCLAALRQGDSTVTLTCLRELRRDVESLDKSQRAVFLALLAKSESMSNADSTPAVSTNDQATADCANSDDDSCKAGSSKTATVDSAEEQQQDLLILERSLRRLSPALAACDRAQDILQGIIGAMSTADTTNTTNTPSPSSQSSTDAGQQGALMTKSSAVQQNTLALGAISLAAVEIAEARLRILDTMRSALQRQSYAHAHQHSIQQDQQMPMIISPDMVSNVERSLGFDVDIARKAARLSPLAAPSAYRLQAVHRSLQGAEENKTRDLFVRARKLAYAMGMEYEQALCDLQMVIYLPATSLHGGEREASVTSARTSFLRCDAPLELIHQCDEVLRSSVLVVQ
eukprot:Clim_evm20s202 gene=Clim_evmTU20s202